MPARVRKRGGQARGPIGDRWQPVASTGALLLLMYTLAILSPQTTKSQGQNDTRVIFSPIGHLDDEDNLHTIKQAAASSSTSKQEKQTLPPPPHATATTTLTTNLTLCPCHLIETMPDEHFQQPYAYASVASKRILQEGPANLIEEGQPAESAVQTSSHHQTANNTTNKQQQHHQFQLPASSELIVEPITSPFVNAAAGLSGRGVRFKKVFEEEDGKTDGGPATSSRNVSSTPLSTDGSDKQQMAVQPTSGQLRHQVAPQSADSEFFVQNRPAALLASWLQENRTPTTTTTSNHSNQEEQQQMAASLGNGTIFTANTENSDKWRPIGTSVKSVGSSGTSAGKGHLPPDHKVLEWLQSNPQLIEELHRRGRGVHAATQQPQRPRERLPLGGPMTMVRVPDPRQQQLLQLHPDNRHYRLLFGAADGGMHNLRALKAAASVAAESPSTATGAVASATNSQNSASSGGGTNKYINLGSLLSFGRMRQRKHSNSFTSTTTTGRPNRDDLQVSAHSHNVRVSVPPRQTTLVWPQQVMGLPMAAALSSILSSTVGGGGIVGAGPGPLAPRNSLEAIGATGQASVDSASSWPVSNSNHQFLHQHYNQAFQSQDLSQPTSSAPAGSGIDSLADSQQQQHYESINAQLPSATARHKATALSLAAAQDLGTAPGSTVTYALLNPANYDAAAGSGQSDASNLDQDQLNNLLQQVGAAQQSGGGGGGGSPEAPQLSSSSPSNADDAALVSIFETVLKNAMSTQKLQVPAVASPAQQQQQQLQQQQQQQQQQFQHLQQLQQLLPSPTTYLPQQSATAAQTQAPQPQQQQQQQVQVQAQPSFNQFPPVVAPAPVPTSAPAPLVVNQSSPPQAPAQSLGPYNPKANIYSKQHQQLNNPSYGGGGSSGAGSGGDLEDPSTPPSFNNQGYQAAPSDVLDNYQYPVGTVLPPNGKRKKSKARGKKKKSPQIRVQKRPNRGGSDVGGGVGVGQNFHDIDSPTDLQPSATFHKWKYPWLYRPDDEDEEEGETEVNIRFFNNFSRMGPFGGIARAGGTATLVVSLAFLVLSNISLAATVIAHGVSSFLRNLSTQSSSSSMSANSPGSKPGASRLAKLLQRTAQLALHQRITTTTRAPSSATTTSTSTTHRPASRSMPSSLDDRIGAFGDKWNDQ